MRATKLSGGLQVAERGLKLLLVVCGLGFVGMFYLIAFRRFRFPMQLDWAEGGVIDMVRRVAHHQALYVAPTKNFVPYMYTPIYYYVSGFVGRFTGVNLPTLRLVSIAATTGCLIMIFRYVRRITGDAFSAWMACGLFAALYGLSNTWFDLSRVDMLYLLFLLIAIDLSQRGQAIWAAVAFAVAFQTKQSGLAVAVFVLAHEFRRPRKLWQGLGTFVLLAGGSAWLMDWESQGWYRYYTSFVPSRHAWVLHKIATFGLHDLVDPLGIALLLALIAAMVRQRSGVADARQKWLVVLATLGIGISSLTARLHLGGSINVNLPLYAWICILAGLGIHELITETTVAPEGLARALRVGILAACLVQFVQLFYQPGPFVPTAQEKATAAQLVQQVAALPGNIYVLHNAVDAGSSDKPTYANSMAIWDVLRADHGPTGQRLKAELLQSFQHKEYSGILSEARPAALDPEEMPDLTDVYGAARENYPLEQTVMAPGESFEFFSDPTSFGPRRYSLYLPQK